MVSTKILVAAELEFLRNQKRVLVSLIQALVNIFFSARFRVEGDSMAPTLQHGESVLVVRTRFRWNRLRRGDVVVFVSRGGGGGIYIKRVVGLPGEDIKIAEGGVYIDGGSLAEDYTVGMKEAAEREWFNGPDEYFLLGDKRGDSNDSRAFGPVSRDSIRGRAWLRCWPPHRWRPLGRS
ncbi:MAG: signal peptidase I [Chloroflexi bacterium]|mgnify:CR=1 FL=1|jgi:signal peptidase I|nr:signal peptidase I [Chloroflexota bacterium]|tara:strand:- start:488 stop:1024 length:537 start_codon:yes stop_codon:yes gene_type:complete